MVSPILWVDQRPISRHYSKPLDLLFSWVSFQSIHTQQKKKTKYINDVIYLIILEYINTWRYKLICSVIKTETLLYLWWILLPNVIYLKTKMPTDEAQAKASKFRCDCKCTESLSHSTLRKPSNSRVNRKAPETITSTERCGPRFYQ